MFAQNDVKTTLEGFKTPVLSLYLHVDAGVEENQAATPAWRIFLKNAVREVEAKLSSEDAGAWRSIREQVNPYLELFTPQSKSLVLFITEDDVQEHALSVPVENRYAFGEPLVTPMLWLEDEYEPYLVVLVDKEQGRFLTGYLGGVNQTLQMEIDLDEYDFGDKDQHPPTPMGTSAMNGTNRDMFESMLDDHRRRFLISVADRIAEVMRTRNIDRLVLGGDEQAAHALKKLLPEQLQNQVVTLINIRAKAPVKEVIERLQPEVVQYERDGEMTLLNEVIDFAKSGGRGALGRKDVMKALKEQRVELLVVPYPLDSDDDMQKLPELVAQSGGSIELVYGDAADKLREEGGFAAKLYYTRD